MSSSLRLLLACTAIAAIGCKDRTPGQPSTSAPPPTAGSQPGSSGAAVAPNPTAPPPGTPLGTGPRPTIDVAAPTKAVVSANLGATASADILTGDLGGGSGAPPPIGPAMTVTIGPLTGEGDVDVATATSVVATMQGGASKCYAEALRTTPTLAGAVTLHIVVGPQGAPATTSATGVDDGVAQCIAAAAQRLQFAAPINGGVGRLTVTITLASTTAP